MLRQNTGHIDISRCKHTFSKYGQVFALWGDADKEKGGISKRFDRLFEVANAEFGANAGDIALCKSGEDIEAIFCKNKIAAILSIEGAELLGEEMETGVDTAYEQGVRIIQLTWNYQNAYAGPSADKNNQGLTEEGRKLVKYAEGKMIIDVSHASEKTFFDIAKITDMPFIASHSNCKKICGHHRNLTDDEIRVIIDRKGLCGINLYAPFIADAGVCRLEEVLSHVMHIIDIGGEDVVAFGCDFDGCDRLPNEVDGIESIPGIYSFFKKSGLCERLLNKLFFENAYNFMKNNIK